MTTPHYVELRAHTAFSFGDGTVTPERLIARAAELGYSAIGITDTADLGGVVRAATAAQEHGIQLTVGAELSVDGFPVALLVRNAEGCRNLATLITQSRVGTLATWNRRQRGPLRGRPGISGVLLAAHSAGLHLLTGPATGELASLIMTQQYQAAERYIAYWREVFSGRLAIEVQRHHTGGQESEVAGALVHLAARTQTPWVVTNDPRYLDEDSRLIHEILTALRCGLTVDEALMHGKLLPNGSWRLRSPREMVAAWTGREEGLEESVRIADACPFDVRWLRPPLPSVQGKDERELITILREQVYAGARLRWGTMTTVQHHQLEHELGVVERLGFAGFFLVIGDAVRHARENLHILCQGRGSAANSAIAYCLQITAVDPIANNLLFERFLSEARVPGPDGIVLATEAPDIDVDIEHDQREHVLDYMYDTYGRDRSAITCIVQTYGAPNALRDTLRAFGYPVEMTNTLSKRLRQCDPEEGGERLQHSLAAQHGFDLSTPRGRAVLRAMRAFTGLPRLRSTHVGGFVLSSDALGAYLPIEHTTMGRTIIQFDKDDLDGIGVPKFDFLGLGALALVRHAFESIRVRTGTDLALYTLPPQDGETFAMIARGDTIGTFQIESRAQISSLVQTRPETMYDLVVQVALIRPGPIQGAFVHPYIRRRQGMEPVIYPHPLLEPILKRTQGIPIFQEQAMRISMELGGYTASEADALRRTMGHQRKRDRLMQRLDDLKMRMLSNTKIEPRVTDTLATQIHSDLLTFANYGFPESHAWSFALIAYATTYLKCHYPTDFYLGILNAQPMGFYPIATLMHDAIRHGVEVRPPCIQDGDPYCTTIPTENPWRPMLRIGLRHIRGVQQRTISMLVTARSQRPFTSIADVVRRPNLSGPEALQLARSGAFAVWEPDRRQAAWEALRAAGDRLALAPTHPSQYLSRPLTPRELVFLDYHATGMCLTGHPLEHLREQLRKSGAVDTATVAHAHHGTDIMIGGLVAIRQRPETAKGVIFFMLEDEFGVVNIIIPVKVSSRDSEAVRFAPFVTIVGSVQREEHTLNIIARRVVPLAIDDPLFSGHSRSFR